MDNEDPLVQALPPATDYLTYLTLLEYQLTPKRLPLLHRLLQDEKLTTNIGWDLVNLLLPMLPASTECLHDVARLGNPREVILRVSEALMRLQPEDEDEDEDEPCAEKTSTNAAKPLPKHILQFNCLLAMLSVLHGRIQTKAPSRFIATSLQAALEAYEAMPCDETTLAFLEFFRDVSPSKRPAPPPRALSESSVLRVSEASAPDPEAETPVSPSPTKDNETQLLHRFIQFGLLELLKSYLLSFSGPLDPGMSWTLRMQEHLHPNLRLPTQSLTDAFSNIEELKERDMIMGKIVLAMWGWTATSFFQSSPNHLTRNPHLWILKSPPKLPVIFLLNVMAHFYSWLRAAGTTLFASANSMPSLSVFPDLAQIFSNFLGEPTNLDETTSGQPQVLLDALQALAVFAMQGPIKPPASEIEFKDFVVTLTACTARQTHAIARQIPEAVVRSHPDPKTRFKIIRTILEQDQLLPVRDSAISWLREELLGVDSCNTVFHDPLWFWSIFPMLLPPIDVDFETKHLVQSWVRFTQTRGPSLHSTLNLYYLLLSSNKLRDSLQLEKTAKYFRSQVLSPLRELFRAIEGDLTSKGGDGLIEAAVGEEMCQAGIARSVGLIGLTLDQIEEVSDEHFGTDETDLQVYSDQDEALVADIRKKTDSLSPA
ncbi:hypothetical protein N7462_005000 [Penicillium macrosclerotiorum]|uniref:uncharacterized protein n=1 Tax=Penicillium macrosclerotiorum TaxID=303699 RepID=UPI0025465B34|nr:uncharacterized protein N7462_005000 [Penicillium macrosclerotiorum]KAJ5690608.1 hypothetical protein N7462_005000 [Penicillium macrosclerotiorum]